MKPRSGTLRKIKPRCLVNYGTSRRPAIDAYDIGARPHISKISPRGRKRKTCPGKWGEAPPGQTSAASSQGIRRILCSFCFELAESDCSSSRLPVPHLARNGRKHNSRDCNILCG
jgi:hypothetical protein